MISDEYLIKIRELIWAEIYSYAASTEVGEDGFTISANRERKQADMIFGELLNIRKQKEE
jgi:hypothetical protein